MLKGIALGGGAIVTASLPEKWIKPVVDFMVVPAHAQTSCTAASITAGSTFTDGIPGIIVILNGSDGTILDAAVGLSPLSATVSTLPPGIYIVLMASLGPITTTLNISTDCGTCSITRDISDPSLLAMAEITLPAGTCVEVNYPYFPPGP